MRHITESEEMALQDAGLDRQSPFMIRGVSKTQFSIARHYGGVVFKGQSYTYLPETDEMIRDDVAKWLAKHRKAERKSADDVETPAQLGLGV